MSQPNRLEPWNYVLRPNDDQKCISLDHDVNVRDAEKIRDIKYALRNKNKKNSGAANIPEGANLKLHAWNVKGLSCKSHVAG